MDGQCAWPIIPFQGCQVSLKVTVNPAANYFALLRTAYAMCSGALICKTFSFYFSQR